MSIAVLVVLLVLLFAVGVPVSWALGISSVATLWMFTDVPLTVIPQRLFTGADSFTLIAIPFFLLAGELMAKAGIADNLIRFAESIIGHIKGGLGGVAVGGSMMFSAVSGSGIATTAAMGKITIPAMIKRGYDPQFAVAVQASSGAMGIIIPPSIIMILYSVIAGPSASVSDMFIGGVIPGILFALVLLVTGYVMSRKRNYSTQDRVPVRYVPLRALQAVPALLMPAIIIGGILLGIATATESAVLAVTYAVILGLITRRLTIRGFLESLYNAGMATGMIMLIAASANVFAWIITSEGLPNMLASELSGLADNPVMVMVACVIILLIAGMFLDSAAALIIVVPVMTPLVLMSGLDPVHFGVVAVATLAIGLATPPVGLNIFVAAPIAGIDYLSALRDMWWFVGSMLLALLALMFFPELVTWLPELLAQ